MAFNNNNAAYDLNLFDDEYSSSSAPSRKKEEPERAPKKKKRSEVLKFTRENAIKSRRRRHNPLKLIVGSVIGAAVAVVIGFIIVGQVTLTELNQDIITAQTTLANTQSVYTQNQMKLEAELSDAKIEKYATETLGMTKASNAQKEFISLEGGDKAEVSVQKDENIFTKFFDSIANLWS